MVPYHIVPLKELPLNSSGKVDKAALSLIKPSVTAGAANGPRNKTERLLYSIWTELLGIETIGIDDNFFAIGGHSLILVQMMNEMRQLNFDVTLRDLFVHQTIQSQANLVSERRAVEGKKTAYELPGEHVKLLNPGTAGKPAFIFPGAEGVIDGYQTFASKLDCPVYAIQMWGLEEGETPLSELTTIVGTHVNWIRSIQPAGPYRLIGDCFGSIVAFETAKRLEGMGEQVELLTVLDSAPKSKFSFAPEEFSTVILDAVIYVLRSFRILGEDEPLWFKELRLACQSLHGNSVRQLIDRELPKRLGNSPAMTFKYRLINVEIANLLIILNYKCEGRVKAPILVIRAQGEDWRPFNETLGWEAHGSVISCPLPVSHAAMVDQHASHALSSVIQNHLR